MEEIKTKVCIKCKVEKELDNFHNLIGSKSGKKSRCKNCRKIDAINRVRKIQETYYSETTLKICKTCNLEKNITEFYKSNQGIYGVQVNCKKCKIVEQKEYFAKNSRYWKNANLLRDFGITFDTYTEMLKSQNNVCMICKKPETVKQQGKVRILSVDHNHLDGSIRGLLCSGCNVGLAGFKDNPEALVRAAQYIKFYKERNLVINN